MPVASINNFVSNLRNRHFFIMDVIFVFLSPYLAFLIRYDWNFAQVPFGKSLITIMFVSIITKIAIFKVLGLYRRFWKSASIDDLALLILIGIYVGLSQIFIIGILKVFQVGSVAQYPLSFPVIDTIITFIFISVPRFSIRLFQRVEQRLNQTNEGMLNTLIIGAGDAGINTLIELQKAPWLKLHPVGIIDDDPTKKSLRIRGVSVLGGREFLHESVEKYKVARILIAMPSVSGGEIRKIVELAKGTNVEIFTLPGLSEIIDGKVAVDKLRKIQIDDLLRREPIKTELDKIFKLLNGQIILVTGAGGSIGSEICRQIALANPSKLLLLGHGENSIFEIEQELRGKFKNLNNNIIPLIADMRDGARINYLINRYKPKIIFHAAAHKHVPLMETNLVEAITNNVLGIKNILDAATKNNVESLVYISTDKAVDPPNVMGATKRLAELIIKGYYKTSKTRLIAVRFGNVLGSRGSVVHTFKRQILDGGPITVTDPEIERFFMTIPEAVQLVLQAFEMGKGGEIFVLNMGSRIKIVDLAKDMIRLSGNDEYEIGIKFTGLRPGEKMIEELYTNSEIIEETLHNKISSATADYSNISDCMNQIDNLIKLAGDNKEEEARELLFKIVHCVKG